MAGSKDTSIIKVIQEMLEKGEPEEKIYKTLREIGVEEKQIKSLLLISQANTFSLLKGEISKITKESIENTLPQYQKKLYDELIKYNDAKLKELNAGLLKNIKDSQDKFEQKQLKELNNMESIIENTKELTEEQKKDIIELDEKIEEKTIGSTKNMKILRIIGFIAGLLLLGITIYKFSILGVGSTVDFLVLYVLNTAAAIILLVLALI